MASRQQIGKVIATIKTIYSYYAKDVNLEYLVSVWEKLLAGLSDEEVSAGLLSAMRKCETPPTPAHIIAEVDKMRSATQPSDAVVVEAYKDALTAVYHASANLGVGLVIEGKSLDERAREAVQDIFDKMPEEAKEHVGSARALIAKAERTRGDKDMSIEETVFRKAIPSIRERLKYRQNALQLATSERKKLND